MSINPEDLQSFKTLLRTRFQNNFHRHQNIEWDNVLKKLNSNHVALNVLLQMENTGGEPDVVEYLAESDQYVFFDCSKESPNGRKSLCYDNAALMSRKANKPINSAIGMATQMGIEILNTEEYQKLQSLENVDTKSSSWLETPDNIRALGGAIFGDFRFGTVFIYHNGAESYYSARGFRGKLVV